MILRLAPLAAAVLLGGNALAQLQLAPAWVLAPGDLTYLTTGNTERGMALNPATGNLIVASRTGTAPGTIGVLNPVDGSEVGFLDTTGIPASGAGTFSINLVGVADDGAIYVGNLTLNGSTDPFRLYRWANESAAPVLVFSGNPNALSTDRWGDTMVVRGSGDDTQVLLTSRGGTSGAVLGIDGGNWVAVPVLTDAAAGDIGLGLDFGAGDTFWATAGGRTLRHIDVDTGGIPFAGTTVGNFGAAEGVPISVVFVGTDPANGLLGALDLAVGPDLLNLFDISTGTPALLDTEILTVDNANANGTGMIVFADDFLYLLDSNNGIHAFQIVPEPGTWALVGLGGLVLLSIRRRKTH
jgi:hypothetical protein